MHNEIELYNKKAKAFKDGLIPSDTFSNKAEIPEIVITA